MKCRKVLEKTWCGFVLVLGREEIRSRWYQRIFSALRCLVCVPAIYCCIPRRLSFVPHGSKWKSFLIFFFFFFYWPTFRVLAIESYVALCVKPWQATKKHHGLTSRMWKLFRGEKKRNIETIFSHKYQSKCLWRVPKVMSFALMRAQGIKTAMTIVKEKKKKTDGNLWGIIYKTG